MKAILVTHDCPDGFGSAVVLMEALSTVGELPTIYYSTYGELHRRLDTIMLGDPPDMLVISDTPPSSDYIWRLDRWADKNGVKLLLYDHHKTSRKQASGYDWFHVNTDVCASLLMMRRFADDCGIAWYPSDRTVSTIMKVNAWDLWLLNDKDREGGESLARFINLVGPQTASALYVTGDDFMFDQRLSSLLMSAERREVGMAIDCMRVHRASHNGKYVNVGVIYAEMVRFAYGIISDEALDLNKDLDYVLIIKALDGSATIRSIKYAVSDLAVAMGGGGHKHASGFVLKSSVVISPMWESELVNTIFSKGKTY